MENRTNILSGGVDYKMNNKLERKYGLFTAICMVVGIVIGSGAFFKAQSIVVMTGGNIQLGILAWIIGGIIMFSCLLTFSFMSQKYERVGGLLDYAEATVGPWYGRFMGWFVAIIHLPAMTGALLWISARYMMEFLVMVKPEIQLVVPASENGCLVGPECMALTLLFLCGSFTVNVLSPQLSGKFQVATTVIKLVPMLLMAVVGVAYGAVNGILQQNFSTAVQPDSGTQHALFSAVCSTAYAYEGWIIATTLNAEIKDSKRNLPRALIVGGIVIVAVHVLYYIGLSGSVNRTVLLERGVMAAFVNIFGSSFGSILNLFVAISCMGTANGLMLAGSRAMYALSMRSERLGAGRFAQLDQRSNVPYNSAVFMLIATCIWFIYYYLSNLSHAWTGPFVFDVTELPIITVYMLYLPMLVQWMRMEKEMSVLRRYIMPALAIFGSVFMIIVGIVSHGMGCLWYLIVFAVVMLAGSVVIKQGHRR